MVMVLLALVIPVVTTLPVVLLPISAKESKHH
jgi:hypothetical protein